VLFVVLAYDITTNCHITATDENKIPNFKHQITNKSQISIFNDQNIQHGNIL
jgi:hypothetical protein